MKARPTFPGLANALSDLAPTDDPPLADAAAARREHPERTEQPARPARPARPDREVQRIAVPRQRPASAEQRLHTRFDKAFLVVIGSELYGDTHAIARNISAGGVLVEMCYAPPLGTVVTVHFRNARDDGRVDELVARAEVKHHHYLNFTGGNESDSARAVGLRFLEFIDAGEAQEVSQPGGHGLLH